LLLEDSLRSAETIIHEIQNSTPIELIAIHLRDAIDTIGEIIGTTVKIDVIDRIFSQFCIGK